MRHKPRPFQFALDDCLKAAFALILIGAMHVTHEAHAQSFTVVHNFSGADGAFPEAGLSIDARGRLYGTTSQGGIMNDCSNSGCGVVFRLTRQGSGWIVTPLYKFRGGANGDGTGPEARPVFGPHGLLYGTTTVGGIGSLGIVYSLSPNATACTTALCPWMERILLLFNNGGLTELRQAAYLSPAQFLGGQPQYGDLAFDQAGNIYGTAFCCTGGGGVFQLTPDGMANVVYYFTGGLDGGFPLTGVVVDSAGNLYGTTSFGGQCSGGVVYELSPSGSGWTETVLHSFACQPGPDGPGPGGLIWDTSGNLYGMSGALGPNGGITIFELSPSGGGWTFNVLYNSVYSGTQHQSVPAGSLTMDVSGNLYGETGAQGAFGYGSVFKLTNSNGAWTYSSLYDFTRGSDGAFPYGNVVLDSGGNLFGTANISDTGPGLVWEITP